MTLVDKFIKREPLFHIVFWIIYFFYPIVKSYGPIDYGFNISNQLNDLFFGIIVFYVAYVMFLKIKKREMIIVMLGLTFAVIAYFNFKVHNFLFGGSHNKPFITYAFSYFSTYFILALFAFVFYSVKNSYMKERLLDEANKQKQDAELSGLKSQVNPHFLFNTLNMIYSSAIKKDDKTADLVLKLSDNFRYLLHEGQHDFVSIDKEISHLKSYIALQEERLTDKVKVLFDFSSDNDKQKIAPLLLLPFIENAFKYSSLLKGNGHFINIKIINEKNELYFTCENSYLKNIKEHMDMEWQKSGIGISNTEMRLNMLYPQKHTLNIKETDTNFKVTLRIDL